MNIITAGTFDLMHYGHINLFKWCRRITYPSGKMYCAVNTDEFIARFKTEPPIMTYEERLTAIKALNIFNEVFPNTGEEYFADTIDAHAKDAELIVIGSDWHSKDYLAQLNLTWEWLRERDMGIVYVPYTNTISTTEIKRRIRT